MKKVEYFSDIYELSIFTAEKIVFIIQEKLKKQDKISIALSGGNTPKQLFSILASEYNNLEWERIHLFWSDERMVVCESQYSNYKIAYDELISKINIPHENIHRIKGELRSAIQASCEYEKEILEFFEAACNIPCRFTSESDDKQFTPKNLTNADSPKHKFDIVILGVGRDGHTASLFPEFPDLLKDTGLVIPVPIPNMEPKIERVSITFNLINASENILILTSKENKEKIINEIIMNNSMDYPVSLIKNKETLYWLISERN